MRMRLRHACDLVDGDGLRVGNDRPDGVGDGVVVHVVRECKRRRDDAPAEAQRVSETNDVGYIRGPHQRTRKRSQPLRSRSAAPYKQARFSWGSSNSKREMDPARRTLRGTNRARRGCPRAKGHEEAQNRFGAPHPCTHVAASPPARYTTLLERPMPPRYHLRYQTYHAPK